MAKAQRKKVETKDNQAMTAAERPAAENLPARRRANEFGFGTNQTSPFTLMRHIAEDMENMLADFSFGRRAFPPACSRDFFSPGFSFFEEAPFLTERENFPGNWSPQVDMFERDGKLVVQADLPGIKKDDVKVEITGHQLTIEGERKEQQEEKGEGFYRSERSYGSFFRRIPLPEGVHTENAKATFTNGVLEISMEAPKLASAARRLEIAEGEAEKAPSNK